MPAGDGVSLPTTLAQLGNVAKTQAKSQHTPTQVTPFSEQLDKDDDLRVQRIKQAEEAEQNKIDPDQDNQDKRQRRRLKRERKRLDDSSDEGSDANENDDAEDTEGAEERLGVLIDMRV